MTREGRRTLKVNFANQTESNEKHDGVKWNDLNIGKLVDWWSNSTNAEYNKRAKCIIEQYGNYTAPEVNLNLNGVNTQGENIADNGGIKEAYRGYGKLSIVSQ